MYFCKFLVCFNGPELTYMNGSVSLSDGKWKNDGILSRQELICIIPSPFQWITYWLNNHLTPMFLQNSEQIYDFLSIKKKDFNHYPLMESFSSGCSWARQFIIHLLLFVGIQSLRLVGLVFWFKAFYFFLKGNIARLCIVCCSLSVIWRLFNCLVVSSLFLRPYNLSLSIACFIRFKSVFQDSHGEVKSCLGQLWFAATGKKVSLGSLNDMGRCNCTFKNSATIILIHYNNNRVLQSECRQL